MAKRKTKPDRPFGASLDHSAWPDPKQWGAVRRLTDIHPHPENPRTHPPAQIAILAEILREFGPDQPIVVDEDGVILKGHGRRTAALAAGFEAFPIIERLGLPEAEKVAMRIKDNQVSLLAGWDQELIRSATVDLKAWGYDLNLLGFGEAQLVSFMTTPGPPAEFPGFNENIPTEFCCPRCKFVWSGRPDAGAIKSPTQEIGGDDDSVRMRVRKKPKAERQSRSRSPLSSGAQLARKKKTGESAAK